MTVRISGHKISGGYQWPKPPAKNAFTVKFWKPPAGRAYEPGQYDAGQPIKYENHAPGAGYGDIKTGVIWSAGPNPRTVWVSPDDQPRSFANQIVVNLPKKGEDTTPWSYDRWHQPDPRALTTLAK